MQECFQKLRLLIETAGKSVVKGETSPEQLAKVKKLYGTLPEPSSDDSSLHLQSLALLIRTISRQAKANEARIQSKRSHSSKKSARGGVASDSRY